jgi:hypothetical protein
MKQQLFCFRDTQSTSFGPPIAAANQATFIRDIVWPQLQRQESTIAKHPEDFHLYQVGEYDTDSGILVATDPRRIGPVSDFNLQKA